ncbi:hypothetical protein HP398_05325 [Brevibacillus sp. HB1.4B]|nr:hypothetical protein [Brevibacillus sp. HB1.4B]NRS15854.1 hypothetical protein [Brevibacillus sp. HB1.4B]
MCSQLFPHNLAYLLLSQLHHFHLSFITQLHAASSLGSDLHLDLVITLTW